MRLVIALLLALATSAFGQGFTFKNPAYLASLKAPVAAGGGSGPDILHWPLNDGAGTTITASVGPNGTTDGTLNSDYLAFNGTDDDAFTVSSVTFGTSVISISYWVYATDWTAAGEEVHFESGPNYGDGNVRFNVGHNANTFSATLANDPFGAGGYRIETFDNLSVNGFVNATWYHFGVVLDQNANSNSGDCKWFTNGVEVSMSVILNSKGGAGPATFTTDTLNVGSRNSSSGFFSGRNDDIRVYSGAKDAAFFLGIFNTGRP